VRPSIGIALVAIVAARQVSERAFRPAEHRFNRESQCRRSAPRPRPRRLLCRRLRLATRCLALGPGGWQATSEDGGSSWKLSLDPRLIGLTPTISPARRHGAAWRSRPRLSRQPCPQTSLRKQQSSRSTDVCSSAPTGEFLASRQSSGRLWLGRAVLPDGAVATRAPRRVEAESALSHQDLDGGLSWTAGPKAPPMSLYGQVLLVSVEVEAPADLAVSDETAAGIVV